MEICNQNSQRTLYTAILYEITTIGSGIIILSSESCSLILFFLVNIFWFQNIPSQDKNSIPQKKSLHFSYFRRWHLSVKPGWPARKMEFWLILFVPSAPLYHHHTSTIPPPYLYYATIIPLPALYQQHHCSTTIPTYTSGQSDQHHRISARPYRCIRTTPAPYTIQFHHHHHHTATTAPTPYYPTTPPAPNNPRCPLYWNSSRPGGSQTLEGDFQIISNNIHRPRSLRSSPS